MTQRELGGGTLSDSFISMVEHDRVRPSLVTLQLLSERLGEPLTRFLDSPPREELTDLAIRRGEGLLRQHRFTEAVEAFSAAEAPAEESGSATLRIRVHLGLGQALTGLRQFDLAEPHLRTARALAESARLPEWVAAAAHAQGFIAFRARRLDEARDVVQDGMARLRQAGDAGTEILGKLYALLGRIYVELGLPAQALECFREAAPPLAKAADPSHQALLHYNMGIAFERQQSFERARWHLERAADLFRLHENLHLLSVAVRSLGILHLEQGDLEDAASALEQSLHLCQQVGDDEGRAQTLVELARTQLKQGQPALGRRTAEEAKALAQRLRDEAEAARAEVVLAEAARAEGKLSEAARRLTTAVETFDRLQMGVDLVRASRDLGFVLMAQGEMAAAAQRFASAFSHQGIPAALRGWRALDGGA